MIGYLIHYCFAVSEAIQVNFKTSEQKNMNQYLTWTKTKKQCWPLFTILFKPALTKKNRTDI